MEAEIIIPKEVDWKMIDLEFSLIEFTEYQEEEIEEKQERLNKKIKETLWIKTTTVV